MTESQKSGLKEILEGAVEIISLLPPSWIEFHHGDCVGADKEAHEIADALGLTIIIHPPEDEKKRAFCGRNKSFEHRPPKPYLTRNREIVDECQQLLACPSQLSEITRSGTWMTIRYSRSIRSDKPKHGPEHSQDPLILYPDGSVCADQIKWSAT